MSCRFARRPLQSEPEQIVRCVQQAAERDRPGVQRFGEADEILTFCLKDGPGTVAVAVVHACVNQGEDEADSEVIAANCAGGTEIRYLSELLGLFGVIFKAAKGPASSRRSVQNCRTHMKS